MDLVVGAARVDQRRPVRHLDPVLLLTTVLLTVFYFVVMAPTGWIARAAGRDFMQRRFDKNAPTYWSPRATPEAGPERFEKQF